MQSRGLKGLLKATTTWAEMRDGVEQGHGNEHTQLQGQNIRRISAFYQSLKVAVLVTYCRVINHPKFSVFGQHTLTVSQFLSAWCSLAECLTQGLS